MSRRTVALLYVIALLSVFVCMAMAAEKPDKGEPMSDKELIDAKKKKDNGAEMYYTLGSMIVAAVVNMF
ncbi:unnamed protein product [Caenorhabditis nigoni]|uniref:Uncharacterized protein n=1 Tax=Caenorhabditis nigoni TaxID=1611254 RepID=A0A2G5VM38_9PELO|nr:hypothetical protein B9Z55_002783 [Caenorhabditis nigoni]PIC52845.1 hypothetical protein B9Z55_002784 [Caenorhabditis nigoni]